jgi:uncharacterized membrane protein
MAPGGWIGSESVDIIEKKAGRRMLRILKILAMLIAGTMLGLAATWATAIRGTMGGDVEDGPWRTSLYIGSSQSGPYQRARIAVHGLLALSREVASLLLLPRLIMLHTMSVIACPASTNTFLHPPRSSASSRGVVRPSPHLLYSICVYDLRAANGAVRVSIHDMPDTYWSVSVLDADTNNFYALNDRQANTGAIDFLLTEPGAPTNDQQLPVVAAPTNRGIVLFRILVSDDIRTAELDAARRHTDCAPYRPG